MRIGTKGGVSDLADHSAAHRPETIASGEYSSVAGAAWCLRAGLRPLPLNSSRLRPRRSGSRSLCAVASACALCRDAGSAAKGC
jgi:hypothetical protein